MQIAAKARRGPGLFCCLSSKGGPIGNQNQECQANLGRADIHPTTASDGLGVQSGLAQLVWQSYFGKPIGQPLTKPFSSAADHCLYMQQQRCTKYELMKYKATQRLNIYLRCHDHARYEDLLLQNH